MFILSIICLVLSSLLLFLKLIENIQTIYWACRYGRNVSRKLSLAIEEWRSSGFKPASFDKILERNKPLWSPEAWFFTRHFIKINGGARVFFTDYIFRYPTLMIIHTLIIICFTKNLISGNCKFLVVFGVLLIWIGSWVAIIHITVFRFTMGYLANFFPRILVHVEEYLEQYIDEIIPVRPYLVTKFAIHFLIVLVIIILAYTGIYSSLNDMLNPTSNTPVFDKISTDWKVPFELFYFSIVTVATVGYGDIYPMQNQLIARLAVASQILSGLSLFVFLLTAFNLTIEPEISKPKVELKSHPVKDTKLEP